MITIQEILNDCQKGIFMAAYQNRNMINDKLMTILNIPDKNVVGPILQDLEDIIKIGNYTYNYSNTDILPIDDGVYDLAVVKLQRINPSLFTPGALPVTPDKNYAETLDSQVRTKTKPITIMPEAELQWLQNDALFPDIHYNDAPYNINRKYKPFIMNCSFDYDKISKRTREISHNYPELVGTLNKCKFVLDSQAIERGVYDDPNVSILERDFFKPLIQSGIINPNAPIAMIATLKYDGVSVEADVNTEVISARTRGDTDLDKASDITEILGGYKFPYAEELQEPIGMKFEAIIMNDDLKRMNEMFGTKYINGRTAIIGILGSSDARKYRDFITLVPLQCSIKGVHLNRLEEISFLNKYYVTNEYLRWESFNLPFDKLMFMIKRYVEEAERVRPWMPFMYDGVVLEFWEDNIRKILGRKNSINQYAMAVKFNTLKRITTFRGYTYTIGQNGQVTPMIHYNPVEFLGAIHTKTTGSSYARARKLDLRIGDEVEVEYVNDVIPYVHKVESQHNTINHNKPLLPEEELPTHCPCCGSPLVIGETAICINLDCPERVKQRMANMISKLGINDFAEASVELLHLKSFTQLMNQTPDSMVQLGPTNCIKFYNAIQNLKVNKLPDYRILGALGFSNIAVKTWQIILNKISLQQVVTLDTQSLYAEIVSIKGCSDATAKTIINEREYFRKDLEYILSNNMFVPTTGVADTRNIKIRCTGFRDPALINVLNSDPRVDADDNAGITKDTTYLLVPIEGHKSTKVDKANKYGVKVICVKDFVDNINSYIPNFRLSKVSLW